MAASGCPASKGCIRSRKRCRKEDTWTISRLFSSWGKARLRVQQKPGELGTEKKAAEAPARKEPNYFCVSQHCRKPPLGLGFQPCNRTFPISSPRPAQEGPGVGQGAMVFTGASAPHATTSVTGWPRAVTAQHTCQS